MRTMIPSRKAAIKQMQAVETKIDGAEVDTVAGNYAELTKIKELWDEGIISETEYLLEKEKILRK